MKTPVVVLAGGTGGAKLARGMLDVVGPDHLTVVANTGDDVEIYGAYVSPDPDLVTFWLADLIDERGWGLRDDTFNVMNGLRDLGVDVWFNLGDRDLALGIERARKLDAGARLTEAHASLARQIGVSARVLPMSDRPVRTRVLAHGRWWPLQEFLIKRRGEGPVDDVDLRGAAAAGPTPEVAQAISNAQAIVIGPSNPIISIGPILETAGMREAIGESPAPVIAVSPLVGGKVVKGPTEPFMQWAGHPLSSDGIASAYQGLIDGLVADQKADAVPTLEIDVMLGTPDQRRTVAEQTLRFAQSLG
ncbi:MAG TPA: 2-phospho-L-lactate transferase [Solirubrobacteraceae bacterium]|nr:2-phospho-L-lactate transferase [Solirubrobacteraceae bacterium]